MESHRDLEKHYLIYLYSKKKEAEERKWRK